MKNSIFFIVFVVLIGAGHIPVNACMCPGFNPKIYPPDIKAMKKYYRKEFKGTAFTGKVLATTESATVTYKGRKTQEVTIEVDRVWLGSKKNIVVLYTPLDNSGCWLPFTKGERYFFIPNMEDGILYIGLCTYSSFNKKPDGNYVDLMIAMFGKGKQVGKVQK